MNPGEYNKDGEKVAVNTKRRKLYCLESSGSAGSPAVHTWDFTYACTRTRLKILNDSVMRWAEWEAPDPVTPRGL